MKQLLALFVLLSFATGAAAQAQDGLAIRCSTPATHSRQEDELIRPSSPQETARLQAAPHGAKRIGKHQLEVSWATGKKVFTDKPPYNEPLDGVWWAYCGYDAKLGFHLILKGDRDVFTGVLLDDRTGSLLPGGQSILFSPDQKYYIAYEQPDGQDGETLKFYKRDGTLLWKGFNGILSRDGISVVADFEKMRWDGQSRPQATAHLGGGKIVTVTLTEGSNGGWEWLPPVKE